MLSRALETQEFELLADPRLEGKYVVGEMFRMIEAAAACVRYSFAKRPKMGQAIIFVDQILYSYILYTRICMFVCVCVFVFVLMDF